MPNSAVLSGGGMVASSSPVVCLLNPANPPVRAPAGSSAGKQQRKLRLVGPAAEPLEEKPALLRKEGKVELFTLFTSVDIQKDYGPFLLVYDGRSFRKIVHGVRGSEEPKPGELVHFVNDILRAAAGDGKIRDYLERNPIRIPAYLRPYVIF